MDYILNACWHCLYNCLSLWLNRLFWKQLVHMELDNYRLKSFLSFSRQKRVKKKDMKCIISFVTEIVETSSNAELGWYMKIIKPNKRTMTHTLLSSKGVVRKWSSVQGLCPTLIPHPVKVISNRRIAPTTQVSFKITGSCNVWGQVNIIYSLNSKFWI